MRPTINEIHPETTPPALPIPRWKRVLDITLIILALPVLVPVMLMVALFVRCVSAGPVLFRQERVGYTGKRFRCFKFRTMVVGNDAAVHKGHLTRLIDSNAPMTKMDAHGDPRIIFFGLPLRASGLDELPQIFNVLLGQMSLVGPRPCVPYEYEKFLPWQKERFNCLPGLTGLWQVSGKNNTTFDEMMRLDIYYSRHCTAGFDLYIIAKTIPALIVQMIETRRRRKVAERTKESGPEATDGAHGVTRPAGNGAVETARPVANGGVHAMPRTAIVEPVIPGRFSTIVPTERRTTTQEQI